ncbi:MULTISPECIES: SDR family NAD(P)-dependent oxidoreductase [unclassified Pseudarthrobacter]|jgi:3-oxoacyl-[acyl-carrier protein] reductase|uniref:SDR family NAD(P)-dependent oxidoreductase n=1 Tax=unclassified Pseudarthrobacter TaxID=2647000 RepID=UPI002554F3C7|nr:MULTISPECIES: SDR family NAD(P)-dependent oxidoreductase [unclassified Pseudarthrobacter]
MALLLTNKNVLVTGGGIGIGREISLELARSGANVAITYFTHHPDEELAREVKEASGRELTAVQLDVTSEADVRKALSDIGTRFGSIDVLVNNAGGLIERASIDEMDFALWNKVMAVNLDSTFLVTHYALPFMTTGWGRIINIASLAGHNGGHPGAVAYGTSKAAIFGFTRGLSKEVAARGITVNAVAPGFIEATPFHDTFTTAESKSSTIASIPLQRAGNPSDVAGAVAWLASPQASFVTGTTVNVNGGQYFA